jgi:DNA topoisomerase IB/GNAT superfamily N-acetyltransferase
MAMKKEACIIFSKKCDGAVVLGKVRDRGYDPEVCIYHVEVGGTEVCVLFDRITGFCEGVNEFGIGVVNSALMVLQDESEGIGGEDREPELSPDGIKILKALTHDTVPKVLESLISYKPKRWQRGLKGHTLVSDGSLVYALENTRIHTPKTLKLDPDDVNTRTNHGVYYPGAGYTKGPDYISSVVRQWEAKKKLEKETRAEDLMPSLTQAIEDTDGSLNPVRFTDKMRTTSQMLVDPANREVFLYLVPEHSKFEGVRNLLPGKRKPKIKVRVFKYPSREDLKDPYVTVPDEMDTLSSEKARRHQVMAYRVASRYQDQLPGGLADQKTPDEFNATQLSKGTRIEMEHVDQPDLAREIAMDHLVEDPKYYDKLETIEKHARYKSKKKIKSQNGEETTVYVYSDRQIADRNRKKAERLETLRKSITNLRKQVKKDLKSKDSAVQATALAVALIDQTYERVGNNKSAEDGHYGVTTWKTSQVSFRDGKATINYVGKSGIKQQKIVENKQLVSLLKTLRDSQGKNKDLLPVSARHVNDYLKDFGVTAKDLRGFHANREMKQNLREVRTKGESLPSDKRERLKILKDEFKKALELTADTVGHEPSTLKNQYLVPGLEEDYLKDGKVRESHLKKTSSRTDPPTYEAYVKRKTREGGPLLSREAWEARVLGKKEESVPSQEDWDSLRKSLIREHGLDKFHVSYLPGKAHLSINLISVDKSQRGEGKASKAMRNTLEWADKNGVTVTLTPTSEFGASKKRLEKWYRSMGFVPNKGRSKDFRFQDTLLRIPLSKRATKSHGEREDEKVQRMLRKEPKKKPPRYDLRNNRTLQEEDPDLEGMGAGDKGDPDLTLNYKKVARAWLRSRMVLGESPSAQSSGSEDSSKKRSPGDVWQTSAGNYRAMNKNRVVKTFKDKPAADAFAKGEDEIAKKEEGKTTPEVKTPEELENDLGLASKELKDAQQAQKNAEKEIAQLQKLLEEVSGLDEESLKDELKKTRKQVLLTEQDIKDTQQAKKEAEQEIARLKKLLEEVSGLDEESLKDELKKTRTQMLLTKHEVEDLLDQAKGFRKQIKDILSKIDKYAKELEAGKKFSPSGMSYEKSIEQLRAQITPLRKKRLEVEMEAQELQATQVDRASSIKSLQEKLKKLSEGSGEALTSRIKDAEASKQELEDKTQELKDKQAEQTDSLKKTQESLKKLSAGSEKEVESKLKEAEEKKKKAEKKISEAEVKVKELEDKVKQSKLTEEQRKKQRRKEVLTRAQETIQNIVGKDSSLPEDLKGKIESAIDNLSDEQLLQFSASLETQLIGLTDTDGNSTQAREIANRIASFDGYDKIEDPEDLAEAIAQITFARNVVANPLILGGNPVGGVEMTQELYEKRALESFKHFQEIHPALREHAAETLAKEIAKYDNVEVSDVADEMEAILTGLNVANIAETGKALPGRPQASVGSAAMVREAVKKGYAERLFDSTEDFFSPAGEKAMRDMLGELSPTEMADLATFGKKDHPWGGIRDLINGDTPEVQKSFLAKFLREDMLGDLWADRAVRDAMVSAGNQGGHDPEERAKVVEEAKAAQSGAMSAALAAQSGEYESLSKGEVPNPQKGKAWRRVLSTAYQAKQFLKTLGKKMKEWATSNKTAPGKEEGPKGPSKGMSRRDLMSSALARIKAVATGDTRIEDQKVMPHPDANYTPPVETLSAEEKSRPDYSSQAKGQNNQPSQSSLKNHDSTRDLTEEELDNEAGEYFENDFTQNVLPGAFKDPEDLKRQIREADTTYLSADQLVDVINSDVGDVLRAADPSRKARELAQEYGRDLEQVERGIAEGSPMPPAIVLRDKNGKLILLGGNTRLMGGAAAGVSMPVKIVNVDSEYESQEEPKSQGRYPDFPNLGNMVLPPGVSAKQMSEAVKAVRENKKSPQSLEQDLGLSKQQVSQIRWEMRQEEDKEHGPGDVWETDQGNWRAKNKKGVPKSFKTKDKAEQYAQVRDKGEGFSADFNVPIEDKGPSRFAFNRVVEAWVARNPTFAH